MKSITLEEYQQHFWYPQTMLASLCSLIRNIIINEPLITRREINQRVLDVLSPFAIDKEDTKKKIGEYLVLLESLHEITELHRNSQPSVFLTIRPKWLKLNENNAVLLGNFFDDDLTFQPIDEFDVVRRFIPNENTDVILCNVTQTEWDDFCKGKICEGVQIDSFSKLPNALQSLWNNKKEKLREQPLEALNRDIAVVAGTSGEFFGSANNITGRWRKLYQANDGIYFGRTIEERTDQNRWLLLEKQSAEIRILHLHDEEQWGWLFFQNEGKGFYKIENGVIHFSIPLPQTFELWLNLFASKQPQWGQWHYISDDSSTIERVLRAFI